MAGNRDGGVAAATLACVQAGVTAITTIIVFADVFDGGERAAFDVVAGAAQAAGVALLIIGAVRLLRGAGRSAAVAGFALELAICLYYLVSFAAGGTGEAAGLVAVPVFFAIMPVIGLLLVTSRRPGTARTGTVAAILAFVQAGITLAVTGVLTVGLLLADESSANVVLATAAGEVRTGAGALELWTVAVAQLVGAGLLIAGGLRSVSGRPRTLLAIAAGLQVVLCVYWPARGAGPLA
jgi:hypothetical protein